MGHRSLLSHRWPAGAALLLVAAFVAACSSSASPTPAAAVAGVTAAPVTAAPSATSAPLTPAPTEATSSLAMPSFTAVPTNLDPCQLVPASEASAVAGASYSAGKEETTAGNGKVCWYGAGTKNVFEVVLAVAPDAATAQAAKDAFLAEVNSALSGSPLNLTPVSGLGDSAEFASFSALNISGAGIYVLKGAVFYAIVDEVRGQAAPTQDSLVTEAQVVAGRLP